MNKLTQVRLRALLDRIAQLRVMIVGDVMLDQFIWGRVSRISPEAPVPVVEFVRESYMPGGAANVARNLTNLGSEARLVGMIGRDYSGRKVKQLLETERVDCGGVLTHPNRPTSIKTRIIAHQQQVVRVDRETNEDVDGQWSTRLSRTVRTQLTGVSAIIVGDYGKGLITQPLLNELREICRRRQIRLSVDPKPVHHLDLSGLSLITPNRKEAFELAGVVDGPRRPNPLEDSNLLKVSDILLRQLQPEILLITLGDQGMLLLQQDHPPFHIPTVAQEVFDVSGAGDTVIASFSLARAAGASPQEAAIFSNHAAGVVVGKVGTAVVTPAELIASFKKKSQ